MQVHKLFKNQTILETDVELNQESNSISMEKRYLYILRDYVFMYL